MDNSRINWRKTKEDNSYHYIQKDLGSKPRSHNYRRPSFGSQSSSWEKKFCASVGIPWKKVLETKKYMYMDQNQQILKWNDSAAEEAFWNAKTRFWTQMHGQQCDVKQPDPDIYIDKIDWNSDNMDPQLILDLDKGQPETPNKDGGVVLGIPVVPEQFLSAPTGWGDLEEGEAEQPKGGETHNNVYVPQNRNNGYTDRKWNYTKPLDNKRWNYKQPNMSRYKISRFDANGYCGPSFVDEYGVKRDNFGSERPPTQWRPVTRQC